MQNVSQTGKKERKKGGKKEEKRRKKGGKKEGRKKQNVSFARLEGSTRDQDMES